MEKRDVVAVVFYLAGGVVRGLARLQNVVFLLQKEVGHGGFWFEPRRFGPWSAEPEGALAALEREGLLWVRGAGTGGCLWRKAAEDIRRLSSANRKGWRGVQKIKRDLKAYLAGA